jgi:hypothetical protein
LGMELVDAMDAAERVRQIGMNKMSEITQVHPSYEHYEKVTRGYGADGPTNGRLKWYDINRSGQPIEQPVRDLAQRFVSEILASDEGPTSKELGFVLLHRCGEAFYFLGLCTWRGNNELWKTIYFLETDKLESFAVFPQDGPHRDTFCVWELVVVCHETRAWTAYLNSNRTEQDMERYLTKII